MWIKNINNSWYFKYGFYWVWKYFFKYYDRLKFRLDIVNSSWNIFLIVFLSCNWYGSFLLFKVGKYGIIVIM